MLKTMSEQAGTDGSLPGPSNGSVYTPREVYTHLSNPSLDITTRNKIIDDWIKDEKIPVKNCASVVSLLQKREDEVKARWTQRCNVDKEAFLEKARSQLGNNWGKDDVQKILLALMGFRGEGNLSVIEINPRAIAKYIAVIESNPALSSLQANKGAQANDIDGGSNYSDGSDA